MSQIFLSLLLDLFSGNNMIITVKDESFGLVLVPRLKVPRLSVSYTISELVSSQMKNVGTVSSRSRLVCFNFTQSCPHLGVKF